jgi:hypothetical protein
VRPFLGECGCEGSLRETLEMQAEKIRRLESQALSVRKALKLPAGTVAVGPEGIAGVIGQDGLLDRSSLRELDLRTYRTITKAVTGAAGSITKAAPRASGVFADAVRQARAAVRGEDVAKRAPDWQGAAPSEIVRVPINRNDPGQRVSPGGLPNSSAALAAGVPSFSRTIDMRHADSRYSSTFDHAEESS